MKRDNTIAHSLHDLGLATWFGGSLMGAVGLNAAAARASDDRERLAIADTGWARWTPVNLVGIAAHLVGGALLLVGNRGRLTAQQGVGKTSMVKEAVTLGALAVTAYSRVVGKKLEDGGNVSVEGTTEPSDQTPDDIAAAQRKQRVLQWLVPAFTGVLVVLTSRMSEQQRPQNVLAGVAERLTPGS